MSSPSFGPLPPIPSGAFDYVPVGSNFTQLVTDTMGNAGADGDGFDDLFNPMAASFDGDVNSLSVLDDAVSAADFVPGAFDNTEAAPILNDIGAFIGNGDAALAGFDGATGFVNTPPPTGTSPNPPNKPAPPGPPPGGTTKSNPPSTVDKGFPVEIIGVTAEQK